MTYGQAYLKGWKKGLDFSGTASRLEFWSFFLINEAIAALPLVVWILATLYDYQFGVFIFFSLPLSLLLQLLIVIPLLAVGCRRMHDIGHSGWWFVLSILIPWFWVVALWLCCLKSASSAR